MITLNKLTEQNLNDAFIKINTTPSFLSVPDNLFNEAVELIKAIDVNGRYFSGVYPNLELKKHKLNTIILE